MFVKDAATGQLLPVPVLLRDYVDERGVLMNWNNGVEDEPTNVFVRRCAEGALSRDRESCAHTMHAGHGPHNARWPRLFVFPLTHCW